MKVIPYLKEEKRFCWKARLRSFAYAAAGIRSFLLREHNAQIHLVLSVAAVTFSMYYRISRMEWIAVLFSMAIVWMAELFNTALEKMADMITQEQHPQVKWIKDLAAAAVLVAAVTAFVTGCIIFLPKIF